MRHLLFITIMAAFLFSCNDASTPTGNTLTVIIKDAKESAISLDKLSIVNPQKDKKIELKDFQDTDEGKVATFTVTDFEPGAYGIKMGNKTQIFPIADLSNGITITGTEESFINKEFTVEGSNELSKYFELLQQLAVGTAVPKDSLSVLINNDQSLAAAVLMRLAYGKRENSDVITAAADKLATQYPDSEIAEEFTFFASSISSSLAVGYQAPNLKMNNPTGESMELADLKGKVVLVDFWAAWCGPCRANNPYIVELYKKYNKQGFEIFSVSLDKTKNRWVQAIKQDKLDWPYHVSELKGWNSVQNKLYQINSIPATFLVDKEGKLATLNVRDHRQLEQKIVELLQK